MASSKQFLNMFQRIAPLLEFLDVHAILQLSETSVPMLKYLEGVDGEMIWKLALERHPCRVIFSATTDIHPSRFSSIRLLKMQHVLLKSSNLGFLMSTIRLFSFASGIVVSAFLRIIEITKDDCFRAIAIQSDIIDVICEQLSLFPSDNYRICKGLNLLSGLLRPTPDAMASDGFLMQSIHVGISDYILKIIAGKDQDPGVLLAGLQVCTNLALIPRQCSFLRRRNIQHIAAEIIQSCLTASEIAGSCDALQSILPLGEPRSVLLCALYLLRNVTDTVSISEIDLDVSKLR